MLDKVYIDCPHQLTTLCQQYANASVLAIDTEFVRTRTLLPQLGLIQINDGQTLALIDTVALTDLSPFWQLLADPAIEKVLHACSEDLEVFLSVGQCRPMNVIDSQIVMSFLGHGLSMGYAAMVAHYTDMELDKSESRTDWLKRPLTEKQLAYAQADVEHLFNIYPQIMADIKASGWLEAAKQETEAMIVKKFTSIDESQLYRNIKMAWRLQGAQLYRLQQLAIWRYQQAKIKDRPISFIAKDHTLLAVAQVNPTSIGAMLALEGAEVLDIRYKGKAMLQVLKKANQQVDASFPEKIVRLDEYPGYKQNFKKAKAFVKQCAEQHQLQVENLASKKQLNQFLSWYFNINVSEQISDSVDLMQGWRKAIVGDSLLSFVENGFKA